jgi:hypothetical protein
MLPGYLARLRQMRLAHGSPESTSRRTISQRYRIEQALERAPGVALLERAGADNAVKRSML